MGHVIAFQPQSFSTRAATTPPAGSSAEILFFVGVRYERREPERPASADQPVRTPRAPRETSTGN